MYKYRFCPCKYVRMTVTKLPGLAIRNPDVNEVDPATILSLPRFDVGAARPFEELPTRIIWRYQTASNLYQARSHIRPARALPSRGVLRDPVRV